MKIDYTTDHKENILWFIDNYGTEGRVAVFGGGYVDMKIIVKSENSFIAALRHITDFGVNKVRHAELTRDELEATGHYNAFMASMDVRF